MSSVKSVSIGLRYRRCLHIPKSHEEEASRRAWWDRSLGRGGLGNSAPAGWLAGSGEDGCRGDFQASVWKHSGGVRHVGPALATVSALLVGGGTHNNNGLADSPDPQAGGLGFGHRRMVLRPRPEHIRQRVASLHLAVPAMFPLHPLHGESLPSPKTLRRVRRFFSQEC